MGVSREIGMGAVRLTLGRPTTEEEVDQAAEWIIKAVKGEPFIMCDNCERNLHEFGMENNLWQGKKDLRCKNCGRTLHKEFKFCPFCGKQV